MKRLMIALLALFLLLTLCVGCATEPDVSAPSDVASEAVSESESDSTGESSEDVSDTESSEDGGMLITTISDSQITTTGNQTTKTTKKDDTTTVSIATKATITKPVGAETIATTTTNNKIELPKYDLDFTKNIKICIDWDPSSSWVQSWEKAFHACYDPDNEIKVEYVQATPTMKASKLAVWKSAKQMPDAIYVKTIESWPDLVNKGFAKALDSMVDLSAGFWEGETAVMNQLKVNDKNYLLVTSTEAGGNVIYNPKVFKNAGLTDPWDLVYKNEWTFSKFEEYAKKLTKVNATDATKNTYGCYFHYWETFWNCGGAGLFKYQNGQWVSNLKEKSIVDILEYLRKLGPTGNKYAYYEAGDMTAIRSMVVSGQIGMFVTRESGGMEFTNDEFNKGLLRVAPTPRYDSSEVWYAPGGSQGFYILNGAKNAQGGIAYATAVRALDVLNMDVDAESDDEYPQDQIYLLEYARSVQVPVEDPLERAKGTVNYSDLYGPVVFEGRTWAAVVSEWEPKILEALNK